MLDKIIFGFTLSFTTKEYLKENIDLLENVQGKRYKHLYKPLKKTGRVLYKAKRLEHVSYIHR
ncbi:hypothetical protein Hanom_Chr13g01191601 [Helianthus anomalus]